MATRFGGTAIAITAAAALAAAALTAPAYASPGHATRAATPATPYDFNGDGYADVALGSPYGKVGSLTHAGFVSVVYGSATGLNTAKKSVISQNSAGIPGAAEAGDMFGYAVTSADFDHDGYADLAVGTPGEDTAGGGTDAGFLQIIWGGAGGLTSTADGYVETGHEGAGHEYGATLAAGTFGPDHAPGFVAGSPGTPDFSIETFPTAAARTKISTHRVAVRPSAKVAATQGVDAFFLAPGDVNGDGRTDVAVGWRDADAFTPAEKAGFTVFTGAADGTFAGGTPIAAPGIAALAVGDFDDEGHADVAVGQQDDVPALGGQVTVYRGAASGVSTGSTYALAQGAGLPGTAKAGDQVGTSLAVGDANGDGVADLAIGAPSKDVGTLTDAGEGAIAYGGASGLTGGQVFTQDTGAIPGTAEAGDKMGYGVALLDHDKDGKADLDIGVPNENGTEGYDVVLPGTTSGATTTGSYAFGSGALGVTGRTALIGLRLGHL